MSPCLEPRGEKEGEAPLALTRYPQLAHLRPRNDVEQVRKRDSRLGHLRRLRPWHGNFDPWGSLAHQKARSGVGLRAKFILVRPTSDRRRQGSRPSAFDKEDAPPKRGIVGPSGGFGLLVDGALGELGEGLISSLLFLKGFLEQRDGIFKAKLFRPSDKCSVT